MASFGTAIEQMPKAESKKGKKGSSRSRGVQAAQPQVDHQITHQEGVLLFSKSTSAGLGQQKDIAKLFNEENLKPEADDSELTNTIKAFKSHNIKADKAEAVKS
ncbi:unnamed protein product [Pleuronectes platessa]|uniref:Uncharacterized protein n=1 Tax=Pleuronectes platessa TaxID=8262 RepID=A0A9N7YJL6_PLEPL|nr:unnamed protein product [Pleuronectes platessa]